MLLLQSRRTNEDGRVRGLTQTTRGATGQRAHRQPATGGSEENTNMSHEISNVSTGSGKVHSGHRDNGGRWFADCGSGENTTFVRHTRSTFRPSQHPVTCKKCLKRQEEIAKISAFLEEIDKPAPATEPQTAAYQAAVDNVWFEIQRWANWQQKRWDFLNRWDRLERWDYVSDLQDKIEHAIR